MVDQVTLPPAVTIDDPNGPGIAVPAQATATVENGAVTVVTVRSAGSQYDETPPNITFTGGGGSNAAATAQMEAIYYDVLEATAPVAGITTISLVQNLNNEVGTGSTVYFARQSFQIVKLRIHSNILVLEIQLKVHIHQEVEFLFQIMK